ITMKHSTMKKKESGAERQKSRKLEAEKAKKSSKFFMPFFVKPGTSSLSCPTGHPTMAASLLESSEAEEEVKSEAIQSETATAVVDTTGGEDSDGDESEPDETEPDNIEPSELDCIQNEFIHMMASTVRQSLLRGIDKAKYYGLMFDTTSDLAHREQMSEVVRYRWEKHQNTVPEVVKSESETRWSAWTEAVKPVSKYVEEILQLLYNMAYIDKETSETKSDARNLYKHMLTYEFLTLLGFWNRILICID
ncbi:hypothetical protein lerEdw1_017769, partial [Lerista edwardsae]